VISGPHDLQKVFSSYRTLFNAENNLIFVYSCLGLIGILHHEMWRDEMQAWLIARDSHSLAELFENLRYEGHPALWHLCLYLLSQFTHNPLIVQIFHLLIAIGVVVLFVKHSPFNAFNRFIFPFGYFALYEYCIISRNYNLGIFLLFLFCTFYSRNKENYVALGLILALLANVNVFALIFSFFIFLALLIQAFYNRQQSLNSVSKRRSLALGGAIAILGWLISAIQIEHVANRARVFHTVSAGVAEATQENSIAKIVFKESKRLIFELAGVWKGYVPISDFSYKHFWNSNFLTEGEIGNIFHIAGFEIGKILAPLLSLVIVIVSLRLLSNHFLSFFVYGCSTLTIILLNYSALQGSGLRHHGHLFILLIVGLWLIICDQRVNHSLIRQQNPVQLQRLNYWLSLFLCLQLVAGIHAYRMDLLRPFSVIKFAADYIQSHNLQDHFILGHRYRQAAVLSGYLDQKIFYPESRKLGSFWSIKEQEIESEAELLSIVQEVRSQNNTDIILVLTKPIAPPLELNIVKLRHFTGGIEFGETAVYLYLARHSDEAISERVLQEF
jgi:hypothetical protein